VVGEAGVNAALAPDVVVVVADAPPPATAVVGVELVGGVLTANWVPVTTVTWAPSSTWVGS
jgi:hypothetical protein